MTLTLRVILLSAGRNAVSSLDRFIISVGSKLSEKRNRRLWLVVLNNWGDFSERFGAFDLRRTKIPF